MRDGDGRFFQLNYGNCGFLESVQDHTGRRVEYLHDEEAEHLIAVRLPATDDFPEGIYSYFDYAPRSAHPAMRHNIVRVSDHVRDAYLVSVYEEDPSLASFNRVVRQVVGGFGFAYCYEQIQWVPENVLFADLPAWQTGVYQPDGSLVTCTFNYRGDLIDERFRLNADGSFRMVVVQRKFDEQGNLIRLTRPDGSMTEWTYDKDNSDPRGRGNLLRLELRPGPTTPVPSRIVLRATYDVNHHFVRTVRHENGSEVRLRYDFDLTPGAPTNRGDLREIVWPDAALPDGTLQPAVTRLEWTPRGQLFAVVSPEGKRRELTYEPAGSTKAGMLRQQRDDVGGVNYTADYDYDGIGFLSTMTLPGSRRWGYRYDALGRLAEHTLPAVDGQTDTTRYRYDPRGRVVRVWRPRGEYTDDVISGPWIIDDYQIDPVGRLHTLIVGANTASPRRWVEQMDWAGRPVRIEDPLGVVTTRRWDERGLMLEQTLAAGRPSALRTRWFYDLMGRVFRREEPRGLVHQLRYDPWGRMDQVIFPNGSRGVNNWGVFDLLTGQDHFGDPGDGAGERLLHRAVHEYDARGRLVRYIEHAFADDPTAATPLTMTKWYDADGRVRRRIGPATRNGSWTTTGWAASRSPKIRWATGSGTNTPPTVCRFASPRQMSVRWDSKRAARSSSTMRAGGCGRHGTHRGRPTGSGTTGVICWSRPAIRTALPYAGCSGCWASACASSTTSPG